MPHELLGFHVEDTKGILLSLGMLSELSVRTNRSMGNTAGPQAQRRARMKGKMSSRR